VVDAGLGRVLNRLNANSTSVSSGRAVTKEDEHSLKEAQMLRENARRLRLARIAAVGAAFTLAVSIAFTGAALASGNTASAGAVVKTHKTSLGVILVDTRGRTLYMFTKDKRNKSSCSGQCATFWPPLTTRGKPVAGPGAKASLLGTTKRSDGHMQVTYEGHPLYRFAQDAKAGQTNGEGLNAFGAKWYAVSPSGRR
jgi:predicted lipoprotein with Yx(FWY)xxD motif